MKRKHTIGPTSQPHYPIACAAAWMALGGQEAADAKGSGPVQDLVRAEGAFWARKGWSAAVDLGLVIQ